jgi:hypothetical protein
MIGTIGSSLSCSVLCCIRRDFNTWKVRVSYLKASGKEKKSCLRDREWWLKREELINLHFLSAFERPTCYFNSSCFLRVLFRLVFLVALSHHQTDRPQEKK